MISRSPMQFEREAANTGRGAIVRLAARTLCGSVKPVVVTRDERVRTLRLYRYPSPVGRRGLQTSQPPVFFRYGKGLALDKQGLADTVQTAISRLPAGPMGPSMCAKKSIERERTKQCIFGHGSWALWPVRALRPVVTPLVNRPCWARGQELRRRSCWTEMPRPAPFWALRPTSPIVNNTRRAAAEHATPALAPNLNRKPASAEGRGGFFVAIAAGTGPQPRPEGTRNVQ